MPALGTSGSAGGPEGASPPGYPDGGLLPLPLPLPLLLPRRALGRLLVLQ
jgi:hypothetical protein